MKTAHLNGVGPGIGNLRDELTARELSRVGAVPEIEPTTLDDLQRDGFSAAPDIDEPFVAYAY